MATFSSNCLAALAFALVVMTNTSAKAIRLYGCYLPHDPSPIEMVQFQSCIVEVNGITTGGGGRWGRDLRRQGELNTGNDVMEKVLEETLKNHRDELIVKPQSVDDSDTLLGRSDENSLGKYLLPSTSVEKRLSVSAEGFIPLQSDNQALKRSAQASRQSALSRSLRLLSLKKRSTEEKNRDTSAI